MSVAAHLARIKTVLGLSQKIAFVLLSRSVNQTFLLKRWLCPGGLLFIQNTPLKCKLEIIIRHIHHMQYFMLHYGGRRLDVFKEDFFSLKTLPASGFDPTTFYTSHSSLLLCKLRPLPACMVGTQLVAVCTLGDLSVSSEITLSAISNQTWTQRYI